MISTGRHVLTFIFWIQSTMERSSGWGFWATLKRNWVWKIPILCKTAQPQSLIRFRSFLCQHVHEDVYVRLTSRSSEQAYWRTQSRVLVNSGSFLHKIWFSNTSPAFVNWCVYSLLIIVVTVLQWTAQDRSLCGRNIVKLYYHILTTTPEEAVYLYYCQRCILRAVEYNNIVDCRVISRWYVTNITTVTVE